MATLAAVIDAFVASREHDRATLGRLAFWADRLGSRELAEIAPEDVDTVLVQLAERGRLKPRRGQDTASAGVPLAGSTLNRYISQLQSIFKYARRLRLLPRAHVPPTRGLEKSPERPDPNRYLRPEEVERLLKVARLLDTRWGRLSALILTAFHTGLRIGNLQALCWCDIDLEKRTVTVAKTKNGQPIVSALSERAAAELAKLPGQTPDALVFAGRRGCPHHFRALWTKVCTEAGLPGRNFHQLRHGCGSALATAGVGQAQIMAIMGHRTLTASARYMHQNASDKLAVVDRVFR
ncbi:site-specific integrase [uncultured Thiodictyon sp.]|uniref:tyrosine-type recombinase/integrase n=1 Tax=uncultured Thiodictyon sp. TaxID=1846217 RepID=UPI0025F336C0|nr:site-specific integrase [uncultured Thiodictyon sp.]